jgi:hypothetical protein
MIVTEPSTLRVALKPCREPFEFRPRVLARVAIAARDSAREPKIEARDSARESPIAIFPKQYPDMRSPTAGEHCRFDVTFQGQAGNRSLPHPRPCLRDFRA